MSHRIVLYGKPGCHLCAQAELIVRGLRREFQFAIHKVDISKDPALLSEYGRQIPVVVIDERIKLTAPIHASVLREALNRFQ